MHGNRRPFRVLDGVNGVLKPVSSTVDGIRVLLQVHVQ